MPNFRADKKELQKILESFDNGHPDHKPDKRKISLGKQANFTTVLLDVCCSLLEPNDTARRKKLYNALFEGLVKNKFLPYLVSQEQHLNDPSQNKTSEWFMGFLKQTCLGLSHPGDSLSSVNASNLFSTKIYTDTYEQNFTEVEVIASGGFGTVCKAVHKIDGVTYAVKKIFYCIDREREANKVMSEVRSISTLNHINIVSYKNCWVQLLNRDDREDSPTSSQSGSGWDNSTPSSRGGKRLSRKVSLRHQAVRNASHTASRITPRKAKNVSPPTSSESSSSDSLEDADACLDQLDDLSSMSFPNDSLSFTQFDEPGMALDSSTSSSSSSTVTFQREEGEESAVVTRSSSSSGERSRGAPVRRQRLKAMLCIQMEFCDWDLSRWLEDRAAGNALPFKKDVKDIFRDIVQGVVYIHSKSIIHRDLKPSNIFYSKKDGSMKIGDFGLATLSHAVTNQPRVVGPQPYTSNLGTLPYMAPEQRARSDYNEKVDIYSLGIILVELLVPFKTRTEFHKVFSNGVELPLQISDLFPQYGPERVRASPLLQDPSKVVWRIPGAEHIDSAFHLLQHGMHVSGNGDCIGSRSSPKEEYKWLKYSEVVDRSKCVGSGLLELGLRPSSLVGIFACNKQEFLLSMCGCAAYSLVSVPIYLQIGLPSILFIAQQCDLQVVIVDCWKNALRLIESHQELPSLRAIVCMDAEPSPEASLAAQGAGIDIHSFQQLQDMGRSNLKPLQLPGPDDLFCIPYTSGTTGTPKGVMLTHRNLVACASSLHMGYGPAGVFGGTILSYLPPAHIYEIANQLVSLYFARRVAFYCGDIKALMQEVRHVRPTVLPLVPRLMAPLYAHAMAGIKKNPLKALLLERALDKKEQLILRGDPLRRTVWDRLLFGPFRASLGGRVHMVVSTSAPVAPHIMRFFRRASQAYLMECYGQTEMFAATLTMPNEIGGGTVGAPLPCNHIKLVDVPEMGYFAREDVGEVCIKGTNVFQGYFKNEVATRESLVDGWQHTGDIGRWLQNGTLQIIDRKKHLFKLSQGEYIAPEKVESAYSHSELVAQVFVDGLPHEDYVVALVVADPLGLQRWLQARGHSEQVAELLQRKEVRTELLKALRQVGERQNLNKLEQARNVAFLSEPFSVANNLLTPTLKLKRHEARGRHMSLIHALYREGPLL